MHNLFRKAENLWQTLNAVQMIVSKGQLDDDDKTTIATCVENNNPSSERQNYPNALIGVGAVSGPWTHIEVHPVREYDQDGNKFCEQCEEGQEHFWSVYVRLKAGGLECVADCTDKKTAEMIQTLAYSMLANYAPAKTTVMIHVEDGNIQTVFSPVPLDIIIADMDVFESGDDDSNPCFELEAEVKQVEAFPFVFTDGKYVSENDTAMCEALKAIINKG